jgi:transposase
MDHFAGLDVSVKETSICIVDDTGKMVREVKVASEPEALLAVLKNLAYHFKRIGLEAGPLSQWLYSALAEADLPVICVETRHMRAVLKAQINKTDRNDARGIAQMMRVGLYRLVHVKTLRSQKLRMLLTHRKLLQSKAIAIDNDLRGTLRNFGLKVGIVGTVRFEARIRKLVEDLPDLAALIEPLLIVRRTLREQFYILHRRLLSIVRDDEVCRRLMTTPGVGPVVSLTYRATVDVPARFLKSKSVGAVFGLTCARYQSGEVDWSGRISRCGDEMMRVMLYEAAQSMLHSKKWSWLKAWAMQIARRRGMKKAVVALARRLAVIMHRMWVDGTEFRWTREQAAAADSEGSDPIGGNSSSTLRWKDVPRGTMDEVSSYFRLDLPFFNGKAD